MNCREKFRCTGRPVWQKHDPGFDGGWKKSELQEKLRENLQILMELQGQLYAENRRSMLIVLQALDAGGKDGTIRHVLGPLNPQGCRVHSFKVPTSIESAHDFLWRIHLHAPSRGEIAVYNRSQYEDVLVPAVHGTIPQSELLRRYDRINEFESLLTDSGTVILKFFLHISPEEQLKRFEERLDDPAKNWKISASDYTERALFHRYMEAYADVICHCSTPKAPWYVIPADHKAFRNYAVSEIVRTTLEEMNFQLPPPVMDPAEARRMLEEVRTLAK